MLKLLKFLVSLGCLALFVWWGVTVPLGERTLFQHVRAIGQSRESRELVRGAKEKVTDLTRGIAAGESGGDGDGEDEDEPERPGKAERARKAEGRRGGRGAGAEARGEPKGAAAVAGKPKAAAPARGAAKPST